MNPAISKIDPQKLKGRDARLYLEWKDLDALSRGKVQTRLSLHCRISFAGRPPQVCLPSMKFCIAARVSSVLKARRSRVNPSLVICTR